MPPELLTTAELADRLSVEPSDVRTWHMDGRIKPIGKHKGSYVWSLGAVVEQLRGFHAERIRREEEAFATC